MAVEWSSRVRVGLAPSGSGPRYLEIIPHFAEVVVQEG